MAFCLLLPSCTFIKGILSVTSGLSWMEWLWEQPAATSGTEDPREQRLRLSHSVAESSRKDLKENNETSCCPLRGAAENARTLEHRGLGRDGQRSPATHKLCDLG